MQNESSEQDSSEEEGSNQLLDRLEDPKVREAVLEQAQAAMPASSTLSGLTKEDVEEKVKEYEEEGFAVFK